MPKLKRSRFRLTIKPRSRRVITPGRKGGGRWPAKPVATVLDEVPIQVDEEIENDLVEEDEVEVETRLPMMYCVVCYNEFAHYSLNCISWETAMTKDFYIALNIPSGGQDEESIVSLPFCPECHSKVSVMFSVHQQLKSILQNFNCTRNNLAFTVVETIAKNCRNGPLDTIRQQIFERWKDLFEISKESNTADIAEDERDAYLDPALTVIQDCPVDHKSMELSVSRRKKATVLDKDVPRTNVVEHTNETNTRGANVSPVKFRKSPLKNQVEVTPAVETKGTVRKILKVKGSGQGKSRVSEMPKLLPMGKLPSNAKLSNSSFHNTVNGTSHGANLSLLKQSTKAKLHLLKKHTGNSKGMASLKTFRNNNAKYKKTPVQLADGTWKCQHCPKICPDLTRMRRHESLFHPSTCPMVCHLCPKGFTNALTMRRHLQLIHQQAIEGFVKCPYCEKTFGKKHVFELHINRIHTGKHIPDFRAVPTIQSTNTVKIPLVSPPSPEITDLESHSSGSPNNINTKRKRNLTVLKTKRKSITNPKISKRMKSEVPDKTNNNGSQGTSQEQNPESAVINAASDSSIVDKELIEENDATSIKTFACSLCKIDFSTESSLNIHNGLCHEVINNKCTTCNEEFSLESDLRDHRLELHGQVGATCPICGKWYPKHQSLGGHMHLHRREGITWEKQRNGGGTKSRKSIVAENPANLSTT